MTLKPGEVLAERYRIVSILGRGGMGTVYRALDIRLNRSLAIREVIPQPGLDPQTLTGLRKQFQREAEVLARLSHPHLVTVFDFFWAQGNAYLIMDFIDGESLADRIVREGALSEERVMAWAEQLLDALVYCHDHGVIHRDIKPRNVIIQPDGDAVLVDLGLTRLWDLDDPRTKTVMRGMGTREYAPPEQYDVLAKRTDPRSDIYSLGATLYHALTGQSPPSATMRMADPKRFVPMRYIVPGISKQTEVAIAKSIALKPSERWQDAREMSEAISSVANRTALLAKVPVARDSAEPSRRIDRAWLWKGLGAILLIAIAAILIYLGGVPKVSSLVELLNRNPVYLWGMAIIILGTLLVSGGVTLLRRSGLPTALFLKQGVGMFHVGMQYPEYYRQWQDLRPLMRLIGLLEIEQISLKSVMQHLRELRVPVDKEQVEIALNSVASQGLLRFKDDDYSWARPLLARVLRSHVGSSGRFRLSEQIRHDHPLFKNVHRFLEHTGFGLTAIEGTSFYRCEPPVVLQSLLSSVVYALVMPGEVLDSKQVIAIHRNLQDIDEKASIVFVITDQRPTDQGWAQIGTLRMAGTIVLPIESGLIYEGLVNGSEMRVLRQEIEQRLGAEYDPYDVRDPVSRAFSFFGRDPLMGSIIRRLSQGRPVGVFGLRKLGKSSLLKALRGRVPFPVASVNLQTIGKPGLDELYARILRYWREWVRVQYEMDWKPGALSSDFTSATLNLLDSIERTTGKARLGLLLDEVELIVPCPDGTGPDLQRYLSFMRAMRGLVEEDGRLSLVVASLNPSLNRINTWKGQQNPAFSLFQEIYLPPLTKEDCTQMVRNIGRQIGLVYDDESVETIANLSGGHPFLARQFCSLLYKQRGYQPGEITADAIPAAVRDFIDDEQTVTHLDAGIWQDAGNVALWGEAQARINQAILLDLARADEPLSEESLLDAPDADARRTALINLDRFHFIHQPEPGYYALCYGLLRIWLRRRKLGLE